MFFMDGSEVDQLIYADWLEDQGQGQLAADLRSEAIDPQTESDWYSEYYWDFGGVGGVGVGGGAGVGGVGAGVGGVGVGGVGVGAGAGGVGVGGAGVGGVGVGGVGGGVGGDN